MTAREWHVYLVRTRDGALYTGIATDVDRRLAEHAAGAGIGAKYLRSRGPLKVVFRARIGSRAAALSVEYRIKRLPKARKEAIVAAAPDTAALLDALDFDPGEDPTARCSR